MTVIDTRAAGGAVSSGATTGSRRPRRRIGRTAWLLAPTVIALSVFIYLFIGVVGYTSVSEWTISSAPELAIAKPFGAIYKTLFTNYEFQSDIRNIIVFTVLLLVCVVALGLFTALLLFHVTVGRNVLRTVMLLPYSLSFIVTGTVWRWIFAPSTGINQILQYFGVKNLPGWATSTTVLGGVSLHDSPIQIVLGVPVAILPLVFAATWQLYGFSMAIYLAGLSSIGTDTIEAASVDGASRMRIVRSVLVPQLRGATITNIVIMFGVAVQVFDLVVSMTGAGAAFSTDMPSLFIYSYFANTYNLSAAAGFVLLGITLAVMIPYLIKSYRKTGDR